VVMDTLASQRPPMPEWGAVTQHHDLVFTGCNALLFNLPSPWAELLMWEANGWGLPARTHTSHTSLSLHISGAGDLVLQLPPPGRLGR